MTTTQYAFLCGCAVFAVFVVGHIALLRWRKGVEPSRALVRMLLVAVIMVVLLAPLRSSSWSTLFLSELYALLTFGCLFILYGPGFYAIHTSLSVQTLVLALARGGKISIDELTERFASRRLLSGRLDAMVSHGYMARDGEQYRLLPRARLLTTFFGSLKTLWRLGAGG
jgi:hypothetical protein